MRRGGEERGGEGGEERRGEGSEKGHTVRSLELYAPSHTVTVTLVGTCALSPTEDAPSPHQPLTPCLLFWYTSTAIFR